MAHNFALVEPESALRIEREHRRIEGLENIIPASPLDNPVVFTITIDNQPLVPHGKARASFILIAYAPDYFKALTPYFTPEAEAQHGI